MCNIDRGLTVSLPTWVKRVKVEKKSNYKKLKWYLNFFLLSGLPPIITIGGFSLRCHSKYRPRYTFCFLIEGTGPLFGANSNYNLEFHTVSNAVICNI